MTNLFKYPITFIRPFYEKTDFHRGVITELSDNRLKMAYSHCRYITRVHAKTFYMATRFLPYHKQRGIFAIYGLCRYLDDLVDEAEDLVHLQPVTQQEVLQKLDTFRTELIHTYRGKSQIDPILTAFSDALKRYDISLEYPLLLLDGIQTDLTKSRYKNFDELYSYSFKVASVVGLMTSEVFGYSNPEAVNHAVDLGIAMQLTNILRDVGEDLKKGRIYLPQDELESFGITEEDLKEHRQNDNFAEFMKFQIQRARHYYESAYTGIAMLEKDSRIPVAMARENYSRILDKIEQNQFNVFKQRAFLNSTEKLSSLPIVAYKLFAG